MGETGGGGGGAASPRKPLRWRTVRPGRFTRTWRRWVFALALESLGVLTGLEAEEVVAGLIGQDMGERVVHVVGVELGEAPGFCGEEAEVGLGAAEGCQALVDLVADLVLFEVGDDVLGLEAGEDDAARVDGVDDDGGAVGRVGNAPDLVDIDGRLLADHVAIHAHAFGEQDDGLAAGHVSHALCDVADGAEGADGEAAAGQGLDERVVAFGAADGLDGVGRAAAGEGGAEAADGGAHLIGIGGELAEGMGDVEVVWMAMRSPGAICLAMNWWRASRV